jgi:glycosyltransferase involved in cell wall biosynthesis
MITAATVPVSNGTLRQRPLPRCLYAIALDGSQKFGSLEEQIFFLAQAFRAEGSLFLPLFLDPAGPEQAGTAAFQAAGLPTASLNLWGFRWSTFYRLNALIGRQRIQLMHWNFYPPVNAYVGLLSVLRPRLQHFFTDHNSRPLPLPRPARGLRRLVKRTLLKRYRTVCCVSRFVQDCLAAQRSWPNLKCCLHFINTDRFRPDSAVRHNVRTEHGAEGKFVILVVANLISEKGVDVALRALALTPPPVTLWVVGSGAEAANLQALSCQLGVADRVQFFGQQVHVQPFMQAADCLACPSLWAEAAGLVNLEALSTGLPVLASRIGGIPEYVDDGQTGLLFPPADHHALAALIRRLHDNRQECTKLGIQARVRAVESFSVSKHINDYLDLYRMFS